jgi:hypothetical protein
VQEKGLLKTVSHSGNTGLLAIFHACDSEKESTEWKASDISIFRKQSEGTRFVAWDFMEQKALEVGLTSVQELALDRMGVKLYWVAPLSNGVAPLGLLNKYNGPAAISELEEMENTLEVTVVDGGEFGIYADSKIKSIKVNEDMVEFDTNNNMIVLNLPKGKENNIIILK